MTYMKDLCLTVPVALFLLTKKCPRNNATDLVSLSHGNNLYIHSFHFFKGFLYAPEVRIFGDKGREPKAGICIEFALANHGSDKPFFTSFAPQFICFSFKIPCDIF